MEKLFEYIIQNLDKEIPKEICSEARFFIRDNKDNPLVIEFINKLLFEYQSIFFDLNLIQALCIPNNLKHLKTQQIYKYLPSRTNNYCCNLFNILEIPSEYYGNLHNFYQGCKWLFHKYGINNDIYSIIDQVTLFTEENLPIIRGSIDEYDTYEKEFQRYRNAIIGIFDKEDLNTFAIIERLSNMYLSDEEIKRRYINKKLGNVGELYTYELVKTFKNARFTAKELGNGFGYDMYYQYSEKDTTIETLIEVKSTTNLVDDYFSLSDNEYRVVLESESDPNTNYMICRILYDINNNIISPCLLKYQNGSFKSVDFKNQIEYIPDSNNPKIFKRKQPTLKLKED
ncbi:MAG: DUF3883 domain-containing protein [Bacilli bacterium]|nr:DUF3883 domain-containing protein [Bacilli bacterium]